MTTVFKFFLSLSLVGNQMWAAEARAQGNALGIGEIAQTISKAATFRELMSSIKDRVDSKMFAYIEKKIVKISGEKPPSVVLKGEDEVEVSHHGVVLIVKVPNPYDGILLFNNRQIDLRLMNDPVRFEEMVRKSLPRKTAQMLFELFFPSAEAGPKEKDVTPTRVAPGTVPPGAAPMMPVNPAYSPMGPAPGMPVMKAAAPAASGGGGGMGMLPMLAMGLMIAMMAMGKGECKDVDKRKERCETTLAADKLDGDEAQKLARESRDSKGNNACSGARDKLDRCLTQLQSAASRELGLNIGDVKPPVQTLPANGAGRN